MEVSELKYNITQCPIELYLRGCDQQDLKTAVPIADIPDQLVGGDYDGRNSINMTSVQDSVVHTYAAMIDGWLLTDLDTWKRAHTEHLPLTVVSRICLQLPEDSRPTIGDVEKAYLARLKYYSSEYRKCAILNLIKTDVENATEEQKKRRTMFDRVLERLYTCRSYLMQESRMFELVSNVEVSHPAWFTWENCSMRKWPEGDTKVDKSLAITNFLLQRAAEMRLKRIGYDLYSEKRIGYVPFDEDKCCEKQVPPKLVGTASYELFCSIEEFPGKVINELVDNDAWETIVTSNFAVQNAIRTMKMYKPAILPDLLRNRFLHSCKTGVFDTFKLEFKHFIFDQGDVSKLDTVACKYHDCHFWYDTYNDLRRQEATDELWFLKIPTPPLDHILRSQGFIEDDQQVQLWIVGMIGRLLFPSDVWDHWQTVLWFYGKSRTGKSTLVEMIQNFFDVADNVIFDAKEEEKFGLVKFFYEDTRDMKFIYSGSEMGKAGVPIPRETFLKLAANERLSVNKKNHNGGWISTFNIHGVFASNEYPGCGEKVPSDSTLRRIFMVHFNHTVADNKTKSMKKEFDEFMIMIIAKCAHAYHFITHFRPHGGRRTIGELAFRAWLPPKITRWQEQLKKTGSFCKFIDLIDEGESKGSTFSKKFCFWNSLDTVDRVLCLKGLFLPERLRVVDTKDNGAQTKYEVSTIAATGTSAYAPVDDILITKHVEDLSVTSDALMNEYRGWCNEEGKEVEKVPFQNERYFDMFKEKGIEYNIVDGTAKIIGILYKPLK